MPTVPKNRFALCLAAFALLAVATVPVRQETAPTFLGVVAGDGMLTPIAVFDGRDRRRSRGDRAEWMEPLAAVSVGGQTVWIGKGSLEDGCDYLLFDPDTGESRQLKFTLGAPEVL